VQSGRPAAAEVRKKIPFEPLSMKLVGNDCPANVVVKFPWSSGV
jgi:hypothetical protein